MVFILSHKFKEWLFDSFLQIVQLIHCDPKGRLIPLCELFLCVPKAVDAGDHTDDQCDKHRKNRDHGQIPQNGSEFSVM